MKQRRKFELVIHDLRKALEQREAEDRRSGLESAVWNVRAFHDELTRDSHKMRVLLEVLRAIRDSSGPGRDAAEEGLLRHLDSIARECASRLADATTPDGFIPEREILLDLSLYASECLRFKRARDAFGGRRRSYAFGLLAAAMGIHDVSGALDVARDIIRTSVGNDVYGAIHFLRGHLEMCGTEPDADLVDAILRISERTRARSMAVTALDLLVTTGVISEFTALDRMDDWKERNYRRG